jgi:succinate dehydrogenase / fumarate reductase flavoprotein subunit
MSRTADGLKTALERIPALREEFWNNVNVPGSGQELNQNLEVAGRVADFLEFGELMCRDALHRNESCGGHFREEYQTPDGEAERNDNEFSYVAAWEYKGPNAAPELHKEQLNFENVHLAVRSYK